MALGLQKSDSLRWRQGSNDDLDVKWRKKRSLERRRSRKLRSQGAGWGSVVNSTEIDREEDGGLGCSPQ